VSLIISDQPLINTPDFHPEDKKPLPWEPMPVRNGQLLIPLHWGKIWGIDFGIDHPFGAVLCAWDREGDVFYVLKTVKMRGEIPEAHAAAMRRIDCNAPVAWPHDGQKRVGFGNAAETVADVYRKLGIHMLGEHSTFPQGGFSTEAAVLEMDQRMRTGRFRVCEDLHDWWFEYRLYHRKDGIIVQEDDDLLSATMKAIMMKRYAKAGPIGWVPQRPPTNYTPRSTDFDVFTGEPF
jgi:hypothetical protein